MWAAAPDAPVPSAAAPPAAPVAASSTVSLVEVSESTVIRLKLASTDRPSASCRTGAGTARSVNTKASMVAMSGEIIPEPLAMPATLAWVPATGAHAPLGKVSVVLMASAAARQPAGAASARPSTRPPTAASSGSVSIGSPITPVEASRTWPGSIPSRPATVSAVSRAASRPAAPVKALAFPALHTMARTRPPPAPSASRHHSTGAEGHKDRVSTPATVVSAGRAASIRSGRPT